MVKLFNKSRGRIAMGKWGKRNKKCTSEGSAVNLMKRKMSEGRCSIRVGTVGTELSGASVGRGGRGIHKC